MDNEQGKDLYQKVLAVTTDFLGPAAERFISRQIKTHLNKDPEQITTDDIAKLSEWIKVAIALLTEDSQIVDDFTKSMLELAKK